MQLFVAALNRRNFKLDMMCRDNLSGLLRDLDQPMIARRARQIRNGKHFCSSRHLDFCLLSSEVAGMLQQ